MPTIKRSCSAAVICLLALVLAFVPAAIAQSSGSPDLVISQAYGGGGNSGSTYKNDFIEIFNRGSAAVDVSGYSVQYASTTGSSWQVTKLTGAIQPGQYFLVQEAAGTGGTTALPTPDVTGTIAMGASGFKVALVSNQTALSGTCPTGVVDFVGTGASNCSEGTPTAALGNALAAIRKSGGCTDTDVNSADFDVLAPSPRNSATALNVCSGGGTPTSTNPSASGLFTPSSVDIGGTTLLTAVVTAGTNPASTGLTVTADLTAIGGSATQALYDDGTNGDVTPGDNTFSYLATVAGGTAAGAKTLPVTVADSQLRTGTANISLTVTVPAVSYLIHEVRSNSSTLMGTAVRTTGVVTGLRSNGFYLQEKDGNFDGTTSTAIYVYTGSTPPAQAVVGNELDITGTVAQYPVGITPTELELTGPVVKAVLGTNTPLPTAIGITPDGAQMQSAQFEKYAGMLVKLAAPNVVGPTSSGAFYVTAAGVQRPFREPGVEVGLELPFGAGANVPRYDGNPEVLRVDMSGCSNQANLAVGDATGDLNGPLGYYYSSTYGGAYSLFTCVTGTTTKVAVPVADRSTNEFTVATFNMWNFAGSATQTAKAVLEIRDVMKMPDIIGVEEVKDAASLQLVADALNATPPAGVTPNYQVQMGAISGTQNVGFLYRGDRVSNPSFTVLGNADKMTGTCTSYTIWDRQPFEMDATFTTVDNKAFPVTVIVNHLRSLIDVDSDTNAGFCARWKRQLESESLAQIVAGLQQSGKSVIAVGDFNAFDFNDGYVDVLGTVTGNPAPADQVVLPTTDWIDPNLTDLVKSWPDKAIYTYVENGSAQSIDHIVVDNALLARPYHVEVAHANADFPVAFSSDAGRPERVSDHDQPIAYFSLPVPTPEIATSVTALDFGSLLVNSTSAAKTITVTNTGTAVLNISAVVATGEYGLTHNCTAVAQQESCTISVTFAPKTAGTKPGSVTITHDASGSPTVITLAGVGIQPGISTSVTTLDFGSVLITNSSAAKAITVTNTGTATLTISKVEVTGEYTKTDNCTTLAPGATCTISVTFAPKTTGTKAGTVVITHDASGSPTSVSLTGTAGDFAVTAATGRSLWAGITQGQTAVYGLQIAGTAGSTAPVTITCAGAPAQAVCTVSPQSVSLSGTTAVPVTVSVQTTGHGAVAGLQLPAGPGSGFPTSLVLALVGVAVLAAGAGKRRVRVAAAFATVILMVGLNGCGTSKTTEGVTPAGNYTLTLTTTSGNVSHTTSLTLTVVGTK